MAITRGKTTQFQVSVPTKTAKEIKRVADKVGMSESTFVAAALVMGSRVLERQFSPETFLPKEAWDALAKMGFDVAAGAADEKA